MTQGEESDLVGFEIRSSWCWGVGGGNVQDPGLCIRQTTETTAACWEVTSEVSMGTTTEVHFRKHLVNLRRPECDSWAAWLAQGCCEHVVSD